VTQELEETRYRIIVKLCVQEGLLYG